VASARKTAIVTGGSQGIGAGLVRVFLDRGYNVVTNSRNISRSGAFEASDRLALIEQRRIGTREHLGGQS
jgi:NAD(P)-dependent dehydrogenase (short-subunit alcohol dehydrogenase family)